MHTHTHTHNVQSIYRGEIKGFVRFTTSNPAVFDSVRLFKSQRAAIVGSFLNETSLIYFIKSHFRLMAFKRKLHQIVSRETFSKFVQHNDYKRRN